MEDDSTPPTSQITIYPFQIFHQIFVTVFSSFSLFILFFVISLLRKVRLTVDAVCTNAILSIQQFEEVEKALAEISDSLNEDYATMSSPMSPMTPPFPTYPPRPLPTPPAVLEATCETAVIPKRPERRPKQETEIPTKSTGAVPKRWQQNKSQALKEELQHLQGLMEELEDVKVAAASKLGLSKETEKTKGAIAFLKKRKNRTIWKWL